MTGNTEEQYHASYMRSLDFKINLICGGVLFIKCMWLAMLESNIMQVIQGAWIFQLLWGGLLFIIVKIKQII